MNTLIRLEEAAFLVLAFILSIYLGFGWWLFILLLFAPDLSMAGYLFGSKTGALIYNLFHHKAVAIVVAGLGLFLNNNPAILAGLVLLGHSSLDRILGFGLKYPDDFNHTHLGTIGKIASENIKLQKK
ncbi:MAG TPA: DUF4260 domain-containing protein [Prolixibacteraceae bacterium]|nr:DUF4260 domain-containing protein [Prolixibacteraceae bacterium]HPR85980.1 DUF4260 domain-containing protein [Prolixibacteraceae bacterium]